MTLAQTFHQKGLKLTNKGQEASKRGDLINAVKYFAEAGVYFKCAEAVEEENAKLAFQNN